MTREEAKTFLLQFNTDKRLNPSEHEAVRVAITALEQMPEVTSTMQTGQFDYVPSVTQKSGKWIETEYHRWRCSVCREKGMSEWDNIHDVRTNFCPDCGAKMESEDKE